MVTPAHAAPGPSRLQRLRRWGFIVLAADFVVTTALGIWLTFRYEPGGSGSSTIHAVLGVIAVGAALVAAGATVADDERSTVGIIPAIVVLAVVAGIYLTGPALKWDSVSRRGIEPQIEHGITFMTDDDIGPVVYGDKQLSPSQYRRYAWLHVLALPVAVVVMGGAGLYAARKNCRSYVPQHVTADQTD